MVMNARQSVNLFRRKSGKKEERSERKFWKKKKENEGKKELQKYFVPAQIRTEIKGTKIPHTNLYTTGT